MNRKTVHAVLLLSWIALAAFFFAQVEIQIEGPRGWAAGLPTWRIEKHWLLDIFWGGRPMTGYHAWIFSFMLLAFLLPMVLLGRFSARLAARSIGSLMLFWVMEDFLWFVCNPWFGIERFAPRFIPWHHTWFLGFPLDYTISCAVGMVLIWVSFRGRGDTEALPAR